MQDYREQRKSIVLSAIYNEIKFKGNVKDEKSCFLPQMICVREFVQSI